MFASPLCSFLSGRQLQATWLEHHGPNGPKGPNIFISHVFGSIHESHIGHLILFAFHEISPLLTMLFHLIVRRIHQLEQFS